MLRYISKLRTDLVALTCNYDNMPTGYIGTFEGGSWDELIRRSCECFVRVSQCFEQSC